MGIDCGLAFHQFGKVVGIHLGLVVLQRVSLREKERFGSLAVTVDVADERPCVKAVQTTAAEDQPTAVAAPRMVAVNIVGIGCVNPCPLYTSDADEELLSVVLRGPRIIKKTKNER